MREEEEREDEKGWAYESLDVGNEADLVVGGADQKKNEGKC